MAHFPAGDRVRVIAPGDAHQGQIGRIDPAYEDDEHIFVKFERDEDLYAFERGEVEFVTEKPVSRAASTTKGRKKVGSTPSTQTQSSAPSTASPNSAAPNTAQKATSGKPTQAIRTTVQSEASATKSIGPPRWYPDPNDPTREVYWDGREWHGSRETRRPAAIADASSQAAIPYARPRPVHPNLGRPATIPASDIFSIFAFVCAGLALIAGFTVAPPVIFGIAGVVLSLVALVKKERLAVFAIGASLGCTVLAWVIQASLYVPSY